jgi:hypothetical protein
LQNLKNIHCKLNETESTFSKMMDAAESSGFYSSNILYSDFTEQQKLTIGHEVGFLMKFSNNGGSVTELNDSISFVCNKLNIEFIDSMVLQPAELNIAF